MTMWPLVQGATSWDWLFATIADWQYAVWDYIGRPATSVVDLFPTPASRAAILSSAVIAVLLLVRVARR